MVSGHCGPSRTSKGEREGGDWSWPPHQPPISSGRCYAFQILSSSSADSSDPAGYARIICDDVVTVKVTRGQAPSGTGRHFKGDILRATFNGSPCCPPPLGFKGDIQRIFLQGKQMVRQGESMALRLQGAFRCRLGRRSLRRLRKLWVFRLETKAVITLQCFFRV